MKDNLSEELIEMVLNKSKLKSTKQRKAVLQSINFLEDKATVKNITEQTQNIADYSTVYRIIDLFVEKEIIEKSLNYENETYYSIKEEHGHYIRCVKCHKKEKINECPLDEIEKKLEEEKGYKILNHVVQLDGICSECHKKALTHKKC